MSDDSSKITKIIIGFNDYLKKINKEIKKPITTPIKKSFGGFVEKNTYDWVYRNG